MTNEEKALIKNFARGQRDLRETCIGVYRKYLGKDNSSIEMKFMSEVDSICPDLDLRAAYRKELTK